MVESALISSPFLFPLLAVEWGMVLALLFPLPLLLLLEFMTISFPILDLCLTSNGKAIIATKRYYFGCGGGTLEFMELISKKYFQSLQAEIKNTAEDGASNIRDVILVTRPS